MILKLNSANQNREVCADHATLTHPMGYDKNTLDLAASFAFLNTHKINRSLRLVPTSKPIAKYDEIYRIHVEDSTMAVQIECHFELN